MTDTKRIAKNTFVLYIRMIIVTLIGLYTSRVVLLALGVEDFGLYNVIGGVVALFSFFRSSMERCTQRFLNVEMESPEKKLGEVFNTALFIHLMLAVIALILLETIGIWFLNNYIQIPEGRNDASFIVFQTVIICLILTILTIPYSACIISHEHMGIFAIISVIDSILNLGIAISLLYAGFDKLVFYSLLIMAARFVNFLIHIVYCYLKYDETKFHLCYNKSRYKEILGYTSWTLIGHAMILGTNNGNNVLINMFHGVSANAAMAIANQVNSCILNLTGNFQTAFNPQITKSYASHDFNYLNKMIYTTTKISYFLLLLVVLPLFFNLDFILELWLVKVPVYTNIFCSLMLVSGVLQATTAPLNFSIMATGRIKWFQITTGLVFFSDLFIVYAFFSKGYPAPIAMWVKLCIMVAVSWIRLYFAHKLIPTITYREYFDKAILPLASSSLFCILLVLLIRTPFSIVERIIFTLIIIIVSTLVISIIGLTKEERVTIGYYLKRHKS